MKTNDNKAIVLFIVLADSAVEFFLYMLSFLDFTFVFNAIFTIRHQLSALYKICENMFNISYSFEDIVKERVSIY